MPNARRARPRLRPLNPCEEARRMALVQRLMARLDRLAAAKREKRRQDFALFVSGAPGFIRNNPADKADKEGEAGLDG